MRLPMRSWKQLVDRLPHFLHPASASRRDRRRRQAIRRHSIEALEPRVVLSASPNAFDDYYELGYGQTLTVDVAEGILDNDDDPDDDPISAVLAYGPEHGSLDLSSDGSFVYTPDVRFAGEDSFTYWANDGISDSSLATVTLNVINESPLIDPTGVALLQPIYEDSTANNGTLVSDLLASTDPLALVSDPDSDFLGIAVVGGTTQGSWQYSTNGGVAWSDFAFDQEIEQAFLLEANTLTRVRYIPAANFNGEASLTFHAWDGTQGDNGDVISGTVESGGGSAFSEDTATATVIVRPVNDAPTFTIGEDQSPEEDSGSHVIENWATDMSAGPANESGQALSFIVTNNNNAMFSVQPTIASNGTLSYTLAANADGLATVTVRLQDNGSTTNGGQRLSAPQTFTIDAQPVNDPTELAGEFDEEGKASIDQYFIGDVSGAIFTTGVRIIDLLAANGYSIVDIDGPHGVDIEIPSTIFGGTYLSTFWQVSSDSGENWSDLEVSAWGSSEHRQANDLLRLDLSALSTPSGVAWLQLRADDGEYTGDNVIDFSVHILMPNNVTADMDEDGDSPYIELFSTDESTPWWTISLVEGLSHGTVDFEGGMAYYTPEENYFGEDSFVYKVEDGQGNYVLRTVQLSVFEVNDLLDSFNDDYEVLEDDVLEGNVLANDVDVDGGTLGVNEFVVDGESYVLSELGEGEYEGLYVGTAELELGTLVVRSNGSFTFTPATDAFGDLEFSYLVDNTQGEYETVWGTALIHVLPVNDRPTFTKGDDQELDEDAEAVDIEDWATEMSPGPENEAGQSLTFIVTNNNNSLFSEQPTISSDGTLSYTLAANAYGNATVTVKLQDNGGTANEGFNQSLPQTFTITVAPINDAPELISGPNGSWFTEVYLDPSDPIFFDGVRVVDLFSDRGISVVDIDGPTIELQASTDECGADFVWEVSFDDGETWTAPAWANNGWDIFVDSDRWELNEDLRIRPLFDGESYSTWLVLWPWDGFEPSWSDFGIYFSVFAAEVEVEVDEDTILEGTIPQFVDDSATITDGPDFGDVSLDPYSHSFSYTPDPNFAGQDSFTYEFELDGEIVVGVVNITVNPVNDIPFFENLDPWATIDVLYTIDPEDPFFTLGRRVVDILDAADHNLVDLDGPEISIIVSGFDTEHGLWEISADDGETWESVDYGGYELNVELRVRFSPEPGIASGSSMLTFTAWDGMDYALTGIDLNVHFAAVQDDEFEVNEDEMLSEWVMGVDGYTPWWSVVVDEGPQHGSLELGTDGHFEYTPFEDFFGVDEFTYELSDGFGNVAVGTITITVVQTELHAFDDEYSLDEDAPEITRNVLENDSDPSDEALGVNQYVVNGVTYAVDEFNEFALGTLGITATGVLSFTATPDAFGDLTITYLMDNGPDTDWATIVIHVTSINDRPTFTKGEDQDLNEDAEAVDIEGWATEMSPGPENEAGQSLTFIVTNNNNSLFSEQPTISSDGTLSYTLAANAYGNATVTVKLQDNGGTANGGLNQSLPQTFTIHVQAENDAPVFVGASDGFLRPISIDEGEIADFLLSELLQDEVPGFSISDLDGPLTGVAVVYAGGDYGVWQFSLDDGETWTDMDIDGYAYSGALRLNLHPDTRVRFVAPEFGGVSQIAFVAWDGSDLAAPGSYGATNYGAYGDRELWIDLDAADIDDEPVAVDDQYEINEDSGLVEGDVFDNDYDIDTEWLSATLLEGPEHGSLDFSSDGTFTYTPEENFFGNIQFTYQLDLWYGGTGGPASIGTVTITVHPINDIPSFSGAGDQEDSEDAGPQTIEWASDISAGVGNETAQTLHFIVENDYEDLFSVQPTISATGILTYTPAPNAYGTATVTVTLQDNGGTANGGLNQSDPIMFVITVNPVNDAPAAVGESYEGDEDSGSINGSVLENDSDVDEDILTASQHSDPSHGSLTFNSDGTFSYTPDDGFFGTDSFQYKVEDGTTFTIATATITVNSVNDAPTFVPGADQTVREGSGAHSVGGWASSMSKGPSNESGQTLHFELTTSNDAAFAVLPTISDTGRLSFTLAAGATGVIDITAVLKDNGGTLNDGVDQSSHMFTITIEEEPNVAPSFTKGANQSVFEDSGQHTVNGWATSILAGPSEESNQVLEFLVSNSNNSLFSVQPTISTDGKLTYTLAPNAVGTATVTVVLKDSGGTQNDGEDESEEQTFTITASPINDVPSFTKGADQTVSEDSGAVTVTGWATGISAGPSDESTQGLTFNVSSSNESLFSTAPAIAANGTLTFTPAENAVGTATITVTLSDNGGTENGGQAESASQTFTITIEPVNDAPVIADDPFIVEGTEDQSVNGDLTENVEDVDGDTLTFTLQWQDAALYGTVSLDSDGSFTFTPVANYYGEFAFGYSVDDGHGGTAFGTVVIELAPVNDAPVAEDDSYSLHNVTTKSGKVTTNDHDVDGPFLTVSLVSGPTGGTVNLNSLTGVFQYTAYNNFWGQDSFTYELSDGAGGTDTATVSLNVTVDAPKLTGLSLPSSANEGDLVTLSGTIEFARSNVWIGVSVSWGGWSWEPEPGVNNPTGGYAGQTLQFKGRYYQDSNTPYQVSTTTSVGDKSTTQNKQIKINDVETEVEWSGEAPEDANEGSQVTLASATFTDPGKYDLVKVNIRVDGDIRSTEWAWANSTRSFYGDLDDDDSDPSDDSDEGPTGLWAFRLEVLNASDDSVIDTKDVSVTVNNVAPNSPSITFWDDNTWWTRPDYQPTEEDIRNAIESDGYGDDPGSDIVHVRIAANAEISLEEGEHQIDVEYWDDDENDRHSGTITYWILPDELITDSYDAFHGYKDYDERYEVTVYGFDETFWMDDNGEVHDYVGSSNYAEGKRIYKQHEWWYTVHESWWLHAPDVDPEIIKGELFDLDTGDDREEPIEPRVLSPRLNYPPDYNRDDPAFHFSDYNGSFDYYGEEQDDGPRFHNDTFSYIASAQIVIDGEEGEEVVAYDEDTIDVNLKYMGIRLTIDENNDGEIDATDRSIKKDSGTPEQPGRIVFANTGDKDLDGVPDYADGYNIPGVSYNEGDNASAKFTPIILEIYESQINESESYVKFSYNMSLPVYAHGEDIGWTRESDGEPWKTYTPGSGDIRLWTVDGDQARSAKSISAGGDFVMAGQSYRFSDLPGSIRTGPTTFKFYVEAVHASSAIADLQISVEVKLSLLAEEPGHEVTSSDQVNATAIDFALKSVGPGNSVSAVPSLKVSYVAPYITISAYSIENIRLAEDGVTLLGDVTVGGTVTDKLLDSVAGDKGAIDHVLIFMGEESTPIVLYTSIVPMYGTDWMDALKTPGLFLQTYEGIKLSPGTNSLVIKAQDPISGIWGSATAHVEIVGTPPEEQPDPQDDTLEGWTFEAEAMTVETPAPDGEYHPYVMQVIGPVSLFYQVEYVQTGSGDKRRLYHDPLSDLFFLAAADDSPSTEPGVFGSNDSPEISDPTRPGIIALVAAGIDGSQTAPGGVAAAIQPWIKNNEWDDFALGVVKGFAIDGFGGTVESAWEIVKWGASTTWNYNPIALSIRFASGDEFEAERAYIRDTWDAIQKYVPVIQAIAEAHVVNIAGILLGDDEILAGLTEEQKTIIAATALFFEELKDILAEMPAEDKGRVVGVILYEVAEGVLTAGAAKALKVATIGKIATKLDSFPNGPELRTAVEKLGRLTDLLADVTNQMCFVAGTPVLTDRGLMPIEEIRPGMMVMSRDEHTGEQGFKPVLETFVTHPTRLNQIDYHVEGADSETATIVSTGQHPFYNIDRAGFVPADKLQPGDRLQLNDGRIARVDNIDERTAANNDAFTTYNFSVADFSTYFAGPLPVWVHNTGNGWCDKFKGMYFHLRFQLEKGAAEAANLLTQAAVEYHQHPELHPNASPLSRDQLNKLIGSVVKTLRDDPDAADIFDGMPTQLFTKGNYGDEWTNLGNHFYKHVKDDHYGDRAADNDIVTYLRNGFSFLAEAKSGTNSRIRIKERVKGGQLERLYMNIDTGDLVIEKTAGPEAGALKSFFTQTPEKSGGKTAEQYFNDEVGTIINLP